MDSDISSATDNVAKSKRLLEAFSSGDVAVADELLDPQALTHNQALPAAMQSLRGPADGCRRRHGGRRQGRLALAR